MATFTASPLTDPAPNVQYNMPADLAAAQQIQQGQNQLTMQGQQVSDMQQEVALRPGIAAGDPNAMNQLTVIDPGAAQAQRQAQIANATMPIQMATARVGYLSKVATGILAVPEAQRPGAYSFALSQMPPGMAATLPQQYPGDGPMQQSAFAGGNVGDAVKYLQSAIQPAGGAPAAGGAAPSSYAGAVAGAESGGNPNATSPTSTAAGPDQFIAPTWLDEMKLHRPDLTNGQSDAQILAMRSSPALSTEMTNDYAQDNTPVLQQHSIPITPVSLYAAHHFGPGGATALYAAEAKDPNTPVSAIFPQAVLQANPNLAGQTADTLLGGLRARMANVAPGTFGAPLAQTAPVTMTPGVNGQPQTYQAAVGPSAAPAPSAAPVAYQPAITPGLPSDGPPPGVTPLFHGDGTPADAPNQPGYQLGRTASGQVVPFPMPGGQADPSMVAQKASATASGQGPMAGGPGAQPPQQIGAGPFPQPPVMPYAGMQNNGALASQLSDDKKTAQAAVTANQPIIQQDIDDIQDAQQFRAINAKNPSGPLAGSDVAGWGRTVLHTLGVSGDNTPYQEMDKLSAQMKIAGLPTGFSRLDIPIIKAVAQAQADRGYNTQTNNNIESVQIGTRQRDVQYRTAQNQFVQQFGTLQGFGSMWNDYNQHVPALTMDQNGQVQPNTSAPQFTQWVGARAPGGRYNPALAGMPDNQMSGAQPPQQAPQQPAPQQTQASAPQQSGANSSLAALEGHIVSQGGHTFKITNGVPVLVQ